MGLRVCPKQKSFFDNYDTIFRKDEVAKEIEKTDGAKPLSFKKVETCSSCYLLDNKNLCFKHHFIVSNEEVRSHVCREHTIFPVKEDSIPEDLKKNANLDNTKRLLQDLKNAAELWNPACCSDDELG